MTRGARDEAVYALTTLGLLTNLFGMLCRLLAQLAGMLSDGLTGRLVLLGMSGELQTGPLLVLRVH